MTSLLIVSGIIGATLPGPGSTSVITLAGGLGGFLGAILAMSTGGRENHDRLYRVAFFGGMWGTGFGLFVYLFGVVTGLY
jgi:hypothetical protein